MSYTEIYGFDKAGNAYFKDEVKNSHRGAIAVWSYLEEKYLPPYRPSYVPVHIPDSMVEDDLQKVRYMSGSQSRNGRKG